MAENLKQNNKKTVKHFIAIFLTIFAANICFAAPEQDADDFFKAAMNVEELYQMGQNLNSGVQEDLSQNNNSNSEKSDKFIDNLVKSSTDCYNQFIDSVKNISIQIDDYANQITKGNKVLSKILIISVLSIISIILITILLVLFKIIFRKKRKNPFEVSGAVQNSANLRTEELEDFSDNTTINTTDEIGQTPENISYTEDEVKINDEVQIKNTIINEQSPTDIKSAVKLFIKITS